MSRGLIASSQPCKAFSTSINRGCAALIPRANPSFPNSNSNSFRSLKTSTFNFRCNSTGDLGENVSKSVLDSFFLGKAIGEILNERIESTVGEFLGVIGRLQTDVSQFQNEVLEKARQAKEVVAPGLLSEAASTVKEATQNVISEATSIIKEVGVISEAASTVKEAMQEVITEAASTVKKAEVISEAASTVKQATQELVPGDASMAEQAIMEGLISDASPTVTDVSKTISSIASFVVSDASSTLLNRTKEDPFLGLFNKD